MATKKEIANGAVGKEYVRKDWNEMSNKERQDSLNRWKTGLVAHAVATEKENMFWCKDMSVKEMDKTLPYNKANGKPYVGLTGVLMRAFAQANHYKTNEFISIQQAWNLGGELKQRTDFDENGKEIKVNPPNFKIEYLVEYEMQPKIDPQTKEPMKAVSENGREYVVKERVDFNEPKIVTTNVYHISEFKGIDKTKLKEMDSTAMQKYRETLARQPRNSLPNLEQMGFKGLALQSLTRFLNAQIKGQDYTPMQQLKNLAQKKEANVQKPLPGMER